MWAIPTGTSWFKRKKNQVKSPSIWSRIPELGSDPPIESDQESGRDILPELASSVLFLGPLGFFLIGTTGR